MITVSTFSRLNQNRDTYDIVYRLRNGTSRFEYVDYNGYFNEWLLVTVTFKDKEFKYYSNGFFRGNTPDNIEDTVNPKWNMTIGAKSGFKGVVDDFRYYDIYKDEHFAWGLWKLQTL